MQQEGIVVVLKPPGMTSSDVVVDIRRIFGEKRVGHTGTLDPAAAGVLPICIGRATRLFDYLVDKEKEYIAQMRFGTATDTGDAYGAVTQKNGSTVSAEGIISVLPEFIGEIDQIPPIYSALSVNGVKLYKLARRGEVVSPMEERKRRITVRELELLSQLDRNDFLIRIKCSKGTYIRTLCTDIGRRLGVPVYMPFLLRTASGAFRIEEASTIAELKRLKESGELGSVIIPSDEAIPDIPKLELNGLSNKERRLLLNGASIGCGLLPPKSVHRVYIEGTFIGLGETDAEAMLHMSVRLGADI